MPTRRVTSKKEIRKNVSSASEQSVDEERLIFNTPSADKLWSCLTRYFSFEDPASRWQRIRSLVKRQVSAKSSMKIAYTSDQDRHFCLAYGSSGGNKNSAAQLLNIVLALEDIDRFTAGSFALYFSGYEAGYLSLDEIAGTGWLKSFKLSALEKQWLLRAASCVPDWMRLTEEGPWSNDARARLIVEFLHKVGQAPQPLTTERILEARSLFRWLLSRRRKQLPGAFLPSVVLLVEGSTEALLLPHLAAILSANFEELAVAVMPAGGANQVLRRFLELRDRTRLPIICLLDRDAESQAEILHESLRDSDELHVLTAGEIEDVFDLSFLVRLINKHFSCEGLAKPVEMGELTGSGRRTAVLDRLWRERGLGSFDKIGLARLIAGSLREPSEIPPELVKIISAVEAKAKGSDLYDRGES